jgi:hypothetical protein
MATLTITYDINEIKADFFEDESVREVYERLEDEYTLADLPYDLSVKEVHGWEDYTHYFNEVLWPTLKEHFTEDQLAYWNYAKKVNFAEALNNSEESLRERIGNDQQAHLEANKDKFTVDEDGGEA